MRRNYIIATPDIEIQIHLEGPERWDAGQRNLVELLADQAMDDLGSPEDTEEAPRAPQRPSPVEGLVRLADDLARDHVQRRPDPDADLNRVEPPARPWMCAHPDCYRYVAGMGQLCQEHAVPLPVRAGAVDDDMPF